MRLLLFFFLHSLQEHARMNMHACMHTGHARAGARTRGCIIDANAGTHTGSNAGTDTGIDTDTVR
jgi:hypothetical protein